MPAGRPTKYRVALREKFLFSAIEELNSIMEKHRSGEKVLSVEQLLAMCLPLTLKDMATKLEIDDLNQLSREQKFKLIDNYMASLPAKPKAIDVDHV